MQLTPFPEQTVIIAEHQKDYTPMPAHVAADGTVTCCWSLTWRERWQLLVHGRIWHQILTFGHPLQPQLLHAEPPNLHRPDAL
jgi:hypothetical protein